MYHLTLRESALRARVQELIVKVKQKRLTVNTSPPSVYKSLLRDSLGNLVALIESPVFRERAFCTRVVDKRTFPETREKSFTHGAFARGELH